MKIKAAALCLIIFLVGCGKTPFQLETTIDINNLPRFVSTDFVDLDKITMISKFRSGAGHEYVDDFETGSSMKHYYAPFSAYLNSNTTLEVFSPIDGTLIEIKYEFNGNQLRIRSKDHSGLTVILFHINSDSALKIGQTVSAGQSLGYADLLGENAGNFDIAIAANTNSGLRFISYFQIMSSALFVAYQARGITSEADLIFSKEYRDANPVNWDEIENYSTDWVTLN